MLLHSVSYVDRLRGYISNLGYGSLATLMGRYYAMDRDKRYERTKIAFEGLTKGLGERVEPDNLTKVTLPTFYCLGIDCPIMNHSR